MPLSVVEQVGDQPGDPDRDGLHGHARLKQELDREAIDSVADLVPDQLREVDLLRLHGWACLHFAEDSQVALVMAAGAALCLGQLLHTQPDRDEAQATDQIAEDLLRTFGIPTDEARQICQRPCPSSTAFSPTPPRSRGRRWLVSRSRAFHFRSAERWWRCLAAEVC
ncbi:hypothetical protein [Nonomuraea sp. CA-141351]|uniref:hypothetical protein n=1 Tax=Nonomuraea sp. CA-141351 TaxID=3239996 RepID=UPI003D8D863E